MTYAKQRVSVEVLSTFNMLVKQNINHNFVINIYEVKFNKAQTTMFEFEQTQIKHSNTTTAIGVAFHTHFNEFIR